MIHISLPAGTPAWVVVISLVGVFLIALCFGLVRMLRAALPDTPGERLDWWKSFWDHRSKLRHDRWERQDRRRLRNLPTNPAEHDRLDH
jgi:hypothetical protein